MSPYPKLVEQAMISFYRSLRENDRRRYAAVEAAKLGHGGVEYVASLLGVDPKTIRRGQGELEGLPGGPAAPAAAGSGGSSRTPRSTRTSGRFS